MSATTSSSTRDKKPLSWMATTLICTNLALLCLVGWAWFHFGSIRRALDYASGERLLVDSKTKSFGTVEVGARPTIRFRLTNMSDRTINLIGSVSTCSCVVAANLPASVASGRDFEFEVSVKTSAQSKDVAQMVTLQTDQIGDPSIRFRIVGHVNEPAPTFEKGSRP